MQVTKYYGCWVSPASALQAEAMVNFQLYFTTHLFFPIHIHYLLCYTQNRFNASAAYMGLKYCSPLSLPP